MNRSYLVLTLAVVFTFTLPVVALAVQYDPPTVNSHLQGHAKFVTEVTAGASGAPAGFRVQWMKLSDYLANGSEWYDAPNDVMSEAVFMGEPTLNTWNGQLTTFCLQPEASAAVEIGDLYDETGLTTSTSAILELRSETQYVFRACANGDGAADDSDWCATSDVLTIRNRNCTNTQGYWKNHPQVWPPVESLMLGNVMYTNSQLLAILHEPARGNGLIILGHQLIAVELNIAQGADPEEVEDFNAAAHALIGNSIIPPIGTDRIHPRDASPIAQMIDDYNNGVIGPGHCPPIAAAHSSWAGIKALYR